MLRNSFTQNNVPLPVYYASAKRSYWEKWVKKKKDTPLERNFFHKERAAGERKEDRVAKKKKIHPLLLLWLFMFVAAPSLCPWDVMCICRQLLFFCTQKKCKHGQSMLNYQSLFVTPCFAPLPSISSSCWQSLCLSRHGGGGYYRWWRRNPKRFFWDMCLVPRQALVQISDNLS